MSKVICCYVSLFDTNATVFELDEADPTITKTLGIIDRESLPTSIYTFCQASDTNKVHLYGSEVYLLGLTEQIAEAAKPKDYKFKTLELEIN